jgi:hypothetical protein
MWFSLDGVIRSRAFGWFGLALGAWLLITFPFEAHAFFANTFPHSAGALGVWRWPLAFFVIALRAAFIYICFSHWLAYGRTKRGSAAQENR